MDTSTTKTNFLSMDFKPLQIHGLQSSSNPLPELYIRGSSLHRKAKTTIKRKKYLREIPLIVGKNLVRKQNRQMKDLKFEDQV